MKDVKSKGEVDAVVAGGSPVILHFWASWCEASKHMDQLFTHLSTDFPKAHFLRVTFHSQLLFFSSSASLFFHIYTMFCRLKQKSNLRYPRLTPSLPFLSLSFSRYCYQL